MRKDVNILMDLKKKGQCCLISVEDNCHCPHKFFRLLKYSLLMNKLNCFFVQWIISQLKKPEKLCGNVQILSVGVVCGKGMDAFNIKDSTIKNIMLDVENDTTNQFEPSNHNPDLVDFYDPSQFIEM